MAQRTGRDRVSRFTPTGALVAANVGAYAFTSVIGGNFLWTRDWVLQLYGQFNLLVTEGWYWQLLSAMFVHVNFFHLGGNMVFLTVFGLRAEEFSMKLLILPFISHQDLLSLLWGPIFVSAGASGAIFGLFGANAAYLGSFSGSIIGALIYSFYLLLLTTGAGINFLAHFGGFVAGLLMGYALAKGRKAPFD